MQNPTLDIVFGEWSASGQIPMSDMLELMARYGLKPTKDRSENEIQIVFSMQRPHRSRSQARGYILSRIRDINTICRTDLKPNQISRGRTRPRKGESREEFRDKLYDFLGVSRSKKSYQNLVRRLADFYANYDQRKYNFGWTEDEMFTRSFGRAL